MSVITINQPGANGTNGAAANFEWGGGLSATTGVRFPDAFAASFGVSSGDSTAEILIPFPCTIDRYTVKLHGTIAADCTCTIRINSVDSALTVTITAGNTSASDNVHSASVAIGDVVTMKVVLSAASAGANFSCSLGYHA